MNSNPTNNPPRPALLLFWIGLFFAALIPLGALGYILSRQSKITEQIRTDLQVEAVEATQGELLFTPDEATSASEPTALSVAAQTPTPPPASDVAAADVVMLGVDAKFKPKSRDELPPEAFEHWKSAERDEDGKLVLKISDIGDYLYEYPEIDPDVNESTELESRIPDAYHALDGEDVSVMGFMLPTDLEDGRVKDFLLIKDLQACCYGVMPMINEWVYVTMDDDQTAPYLDNTPIKVTGTFFVGERVQDGMIVNLYRLRATEVKAIDEIPGFTPMEIPKDFQGEF